MGEFPVGAPPRPSMRVEFLATIAITFALGYATAAPDAGSSKCAESCFGENCDFWVKQWGLACDTVEKEYGCSCGGCQCEKPIADDDHERSYGVRRTGTGVGSAQTPAPTPVPTIAGEFKISTTVNFVGVTVFGTVEKKAACQALTTGLSANSALTLSESDCVVTSVSISRRAGAQVGFDLYTGTADSSVASAAATSLSTFLTATGATGFKDKFNTQATALGSSQQTTGVSVVSAPATTQTTPSPTSTPTGTPTATPTGTPAPTPTEVDSAPPGTSLSIAAIVGVALVLKQQLLL